MKGLGKGSAAFLLPQLFTRCRNTTRQPPNILWIVSEDNSPFLRCYGDDLAETPHLDKLAVEGFYTLTPMRMLLFVPRLEIP